MVAEWALNGLGAEWALILKNVIVYPKSDLFPKCDAIFTKMDVVFVGSFGRMGS